MTKNVAPLAGAWIEINLENLYQVIAVESLPSRERGLKYIFNALLSDFLFVAPLAGAWIEIRIYLSEEYP